MRVEEPAAARPGSSPVQRPVGTVVHHITEPLVRAAAPDSAAGTDEAPTATGSGTDGPADGEAAPAGFGASGTAESEVDAEAAPETTDPGRFSLDGLAPQHLVGRVVEAKPVTTVVHGAGSLLRPVRGALGPEAGAERPGPSLSGLTRPVAHGLHQLTSPLWNHASAAPPATAPIGPVDAAPATEIPQAPPGGPVVRTAPQPAPASTGFTAFAAFAADDAGGTVTGEPAAPGQDLPWTPGKAATLPLSASGATGHAADGSGGSGGVGLTWPLSSAPAHLAALRSLDRAGISVPGSAFAASPGATPD